MTNEEKKQFIADLCNNIRDKITSEIDNLPEEWDGHELRELIADNFNNSKSPYLKGKRKKDYTNECLIRNLT